MLFLVLILLENTLLTSSFSILRGHRPSVQRGIAIEDIVFQWETGPLYMTDIQVDQSNVESAPNEVIQQMNVSSFQLLAENALNCLYKSDLKRLSGHDGASAGWTSWVEESSAFELEQVLNKVVLNTFTDTSSTSKRDRLLKYMKWLKSTPKPAMIELTPQFRDCADKVLLDSDLVHIKINDRDELLQRMGCRLILLPSGKEMDYPLVTPPGGMAYGKIIYGGAKRFRYLRSARKNVPVRITGEATSIKVSDADNPRSWTQFGGPERNYRAIDMGPACILEVIILTKDLKLPLLSEDEENMQMTLSNFKFDPHEMFQFWNDTANGYAIEEKQKLSNTSDHDSSRYPSSFDSIASSSVQGLDQQIETIVRRVLDGRVISVENEAEDKQRVLSDEAKTLEALGLTPVKGLLLYGPPGCGKTLLAREISKYLKANSPKILSAPELLDRWVGGSEKLIRNLFYEAEEELKACGGDATKSSLHVIVIDEIDAVFRKRSSASDSGEVTRASAVNQILAKLDGINSLGNVLVIGMTNKRELLDDALLRPGRLEVQIEIPKPNREGRRHIMQLHFNALRLQGRLSDPLMEAIDGKQKKDAQIMNTRGWFRKSIEDGYAGNIRTHDLSAEKYTGGFSGADIAGLVRCAGSIALERSRKDGGGVENLVVTLEDVVSALSEIKK